MSPLSTPEDFLDSGAESLSAINSPQAIADGQEFRAWPEGRAKKPNNFYARACAQGQANPDSALYPLRQSLCATFSRLRSERSICLVRVLKSTKAMMNLHRRANDMAVSKYFANTYSEARTKFLAAARTSGANLAHHRLPKYLGPENKELFVDVAVLGPQDPENLLVLISGTHGVEGFCGSGCQVGYLTDQLYEALSPTSGAMLIHALNPFGFAWRRRVNEGNVDLNRNFHDFAAPLPSSERYEALHDWLIPTEWEGEQREQADAVL